MNSTPLAIANVRLFTGTGLTQARTVVIDGNVISDVQDCRKNIDGRGLTPLEALRAATIVAAEHFDLPDRGAIEPGRRADLVLISGDPLQNISATRSIGRVWIDGVETGGN